jgi:multidrug efflux system membrane fusion protein
MSWPFCPHFLSVLLGFAIAFTGCSSQKKTRSVRVPVKVAHATEQSMPYSLAAVGTVEALRTAAIGSQVGGVITRVAFREGDVVRKGQVLIQIDPRPFHAALEQAKATLQPASTPSAAEASTKRRSSRRRNGTRRGRPPKRSPPPCGPTPRRS